MNILLKGITNKPYTTILSIMYQLPDGETITVAADKVSFYSYDYEEDYCRFDLTLVGCYVIDESVQDPDEEGIERCLISLDIPTINNSELIAYMVHEDTVPDYDVRFESFWAY